MARVRDEFPAPFSNDDPAGALLPRAWVVLSLLAAALLIAASARAEQLGLDLLSTTVASAVVDDGASMDEIVVLGKAADEEEGGRILSDPLLRKILRDFEMQQQLEDEFEALVEKRGLAAQQPPFRLGYDPVAEAHEQVVLDPGPLPLDLIEPAVIIKVDF